MGVDMPIEESFTSPWMASGRVATQLCGDVFGGYIVVRYFSKGEAVGMIRISVTREVTQIYLHTSGSLHVLYTCPSSSTENFRAVFIFSL
jgi:hypothetical protein